MSGKLAETITTLIARPDTEPWLVLTAETLVSLVMVLGLYGLARAMRLGGDVRLIDADHAIRLAEAAIAGFDAREVTLDRARIGALVRNGEGRVLLIRRHGARFVGREVTSHEGIRLDRHTLTLETGDPRFGPLTLDLGEQAQIWAASLRRLHADQEHAA
ncbi:hypothetical protein [Novosphingobium sp. Fuku2-ISO-50]|uniref:hypothetical protein n=1 Tax=Novosphingobium sp. Fuku2-ISO-50 TaxID=1739114 RepID=UPI00076D3288|nr:hypothetical protein [Novosphingobium sp. Fuku2-ISO-50]KUR75500.1 hypothetical protein AQZ50_15210 [Novosphingobium sp. Fuku2-ISO-50]